MSLSRPTEALNATALRLNQVGCEEISARPGINEVLRVSIHYHDGRLPDSIATLVRRQGSDSCSLTAVYDRYDRQGDLYQYEFSITMPRFQTLLTTFRELRFDHLDDASELDAFRMDLWLIERAAGRFKHGVLVSPQNMTGHHRELLVALRTHLPEAVRELVS